MTVAAKSAAKTATKSAAKIATRTAAKTATRTATRTAAKTATRTATRTSARTARDAYDVVVVGAGVVGAATARELARFHLRIVVLEAGLDLACGATRANSGIVHAGFDPLPGTLKAKYNVAGASLYPRWQRELGFGYYQNGALVLAFSAADLAMLEELRERAGANGVQGVQIVDRDELRAMEPNVSPDAIAALSAPTSGICDPYGLTYGAAENAAENGVEFLFDHAVCGIERVEGGFVVLTRNGSAFSARAVVNCAGVHADEVNNLVSARKLCIEPVKGEYLLYHNALAGAFRRSVFQAPDARGKGTLVSPVLFGNIFIGPNASAADGKDDVATTPEGQAQVLERARRIWPAAATDKVIATYAGLRARDASGSGDFVIGEAPDAEGFFNAACIDSPGLASAPAIAVDLARMVANRLGAGLRADFDPQRVPAPLLAMMQEDAVARLVDGNPAYGVPVCKCCHVSEGEIVDALHRPIPVLSLDALKWRTGATMGPCHGGRCTARIVQLVMRELGEDGSRIQKRLQGSHLVVSGEGAAVEDDVHAQVAGLAAELRETFDARGLREEGSGSLGMTGERPAGVYSALEALELLAATRHLPGKRAVVWGTHDAALRAAFALADAGVCLEAVVESAQEPACSAELAAALAERGVPVECDARVASVSGANRVEGVVIETRGERRAVPCDMLVASTCVVPE